MALGKFKMALKDFETVAKQRPNDSDARNKFQECQKIVKRQAFEKAIAVEDGGSHSVSDEIDIHVLSVEDSYKGPHLTSDCKITSQFMDELLDHYRSENKLHKKYAYQILIEAKKYFSSLPSLIDINVPTGKKFTLCGDIHGQFYDLLNIFELNGRPSPDNPYLFNGDFVDRGSFSVECIFTLLGYKLLYPDSFFMSRGNHESETMNQMYGFDGEVKSKYDARMAKLFTEVFNWLPLAHVINNRIMAMHGGLFSEDNITLDDIRKTSRNHQPPDSGIMCELLWSDPQPQPGRGPSKRGVGVQFGPDVTQRFCEANGLDYVVRSHEVKDSGYEVAHNGRCITVFSAPNYCDTMGNRGAFITLTGSSQKLEPQFTSFKAVHHPNVRPMAYANSLLSLLS